MRKNHKIVKPDRSVVAFGKNITFPGRFKVEKGLLFNDSLAAVRGKE